MGGRVSKKKKKKIALQMLKQGKFLMKTG